MGVWELRLPRRALPSAPCSPKLPLPLEEEERATRRSRSTMMRALRARFSPRQARAQWLWAIVVQVIPPLPRLTPQK